MKSTKEVGDLIAEYGRVRLMMGELLGGILCIDASESAASVVQIVFKCGAAERTMRNIGTIRLAVEQLWSGDLFVATIEAA